MRKRSVKGPYPFSREEGSLESALRAARRRHAFYKEEIDPEPDNLNKADSLKGFHGLNDRNDLQPDEK